MDAFGLALSLQLDAFSPFLVTTETTDHGLVCREIKRCENITIIIITITTTIPELPHQRVYLTVPCACVAKYLLLLLLLHRLGSCASAAPTPQPRKNSLPVFACQASPRKTASSSFARGQPHKTNTPFVLSARCQDCCCGGRCRCSTHLESRHTHKNTHTHTHARARALPQRHKPLVMHIVSKLYYFRSIYRTSKYYRIEKAFRPRSPGIPDFF